MNDILGKNTRLYSLDALRGFDVLFITGAGTVLKGFAALIGLTFMGGQMGHVPWHGFVVYDIIFQLFLLYTFLFPWPSNESIPRITYPFIGISLNVQ